MQLTKVFILSLMLIVVLRVLFYAISIFLSNGDYAIVSEGHKAQMKDNSTCSLQGCDNGSLFITGTINDTLLEGGDCEHPLLFSVRFLQNCAIKLRITEDHVDLRQEKRWEAPVGDVNMPLLESLDVNVLPKGKCELLGATVTLF